MDKEAYISTLKNPNSWFDQAFSQKMVADKILNEIIMNREFIVKLKETQDYDEFVGLWANALYHYGIGIENGLKGIIIKNGRKYLMRQVIWELDLFCLPAVNHLSAEILLQSTIQC